MPGKAPEPEDAIGPFVIGPFAIGRLPRVDFGSGRFAALPAAIAGHGRVALVVTGRRSFRASDRYRWLVAELERAGIQRFELPTTGSEPTPEGIDLAVAANRERRIDVVVGIGGGSVLDTAKAVAGLLKPGNSIMDHLEGVGPELPYQGPATPWIAVPTTAGTGSEATRNAVVSMPGRFKKSFRDERLVAGEAIVDPDLLAGSPAPLIAANGMDALTQLIESYVSVRAGPFTDPLALAGLRAARAGLRDWHAAAVQGLPDDPRAVAGQTRMAYAALLSGITLAHAGLGADHGLAAAVGALFPIPHGAACGALLVATVAVNIAALRSRDPGGQALERYAELGRIVAGRPSLDGADARRALVAELGSWHAQLELAGLRTFSVTPADIPRIVADSRGSSMRTNPITLTDDEIAEIVSRSL